MQFIIYIILICVMQHLKRKQKEQFHDRRAKNNKDVKRISC